MANVEVIEVDGIRFRRYPDSLHRQHRVYFQAHRGNNAPPIYLHRYLWGREHGAIPGGHHIHHIDGDPLNNELSNLACIPPDAHADEHRKEFMERATAPQQLEHLARIRPLAGEWHSTPEGRQWHSENGKRSWLNREPRRHVCECCGEGFETMHYGEVRYCSASCGNRAWHKANKRPSRYKRLGAPEPRQCEFCGNQFQPLRRTKRALCSTACRNGDYLRQKRAADGAD